MTSYGSEEGVKKPKFVPYDAHLLAASAQEMINKCEQQKRAIPELSVGVASSTSKAPVQRGSSAEDEWESQLSKWKNRRRSSGGSYQPKVIDIDVDTGAEISSQSNDQRKQKTFKELSESRSDSSGRGYLYPVEDLENINPATCDSATSTATTCTNSRLSFTLDNNASANSAHSMTSSTVLPHRDAEINGQSDIVRMLSETETFSNKTEESDNGRRSIIIELPAEKSTKDLEIRGDKLTTDSLKPGVKTEVKLPDDALKSGVKAEVKLSQETFWSGDSCSVTTASKGPTMVMRDKATLSAPAVAARPTSALVSSRLAGFQKEEISFAKPDKNPPPPVSRIRLNDSPWEAKVDAKPVSDVIRRPEPTRQGTKVRNFLSHYDTLQSETANNDETAKHSIKPAPTVESRRSVESNRHSGTGLSFTRTGTDYGFTVDVTKSSDASAVKADNSLTANTKHADEVTKSDFHSSQVLILSPMKSEESSKPETRLSVIPGASVKPHVDDIKTSVSPKNGSPLARSPRSNSPELGHAEKSEISNGDGLKVGLSVSQLSKALGPKLNNLGGLIGGPKPKAEAPVPKPRPAPPAVKPRPEAPKTKPKPEPPKPASKPSMQSTDVVDYSATSASSGVILKVSRPEGAPPSDLDLVPSTHLLDSSASKDRSRLSTCGSLAVRRRPTLKGSRPTNLTAPSTTMQNGDAGSHSNHSSSSSMNHIPEADDEPDSLSPSHSSPQHTDVFTTSHSDQSVNSRTPPSLTQAPATIIQDTPTVAETAPAIVHTTPAIVEAKSIPMEVPSLPKKTEEIMEPTLLTKKMDEIKATDIDESFGADVKISNEKSGDLFDVAGEQNSAASKIIDVVTPKDANLGDLLPPDDAPPPLPSCPPPELNFDTFPVPSSSINESASSSGVTGLEPAASSKEEQMRRKCEFLGLSAEQSQEYNALKSTSEVKLFQSSSTLDIQLTGDPVSISASNSKFTVPFSTKSTILETGKHSERYRSDEPSELDWNLKAKSNNQFPVISVTNEAACLPFEAFPATLPAINADSSMLISLSESPNSDRRLKTNENVFCEKDSKQYSNPLESTMARSESQNVQYEENSLTSRKAHQEDVKTLEFNSRSVVNDLIDLSEGLAASTERENSNEVGPSNKIMTSNLAELAFLEDDSAKRMETFEISSKNINAKEKANEKSASNQQAHNLNFQDLFDQISQKSSLNKSQNQDLFQSEDLDSNLMEFDPLMTNNLSKSKSKSVDVLNSFSHFEATADFEADGSNTDDIKRNDNLMVFQNMDLLSARKNVGSSEEAFERNNSNLRNERSGNLQETDDTIVSKQGMKRYLSQEYLITRKPFHLPAQSSVAMTTNSVTSLDESLMTTRTRLNSVPKQRILNSNAWIKK